MPAETAASRAFVYFWCGGGALILLFLACRWLFPDDKTKEMEHAPGREVIFPYGTLLHEDLYPGSIFNHGGSIMRIYGADVPPEQIAAFYDDALTKLGYTRVAPVHDPHFGGPVLAQWVNGPFTYRVFLEPPPNRINGSVYTNQFKYYPYARLSNAPDN